MEPWDDVLDGIVFDAVRTLIHPVQPIVSTYHSYGCRFGSRRTPREIADRFATAFRAAVWEPATNEHYYETWRGIVAAVFHGTVDDFDSLFDELWRYFGRPDSWRVNDGTGEVLGALQARGKRLAIASNFDDRLHGICAHQRELALCRTILPATELGAAKPDPKFFDAVAKTLQLEPGRLLMVGDDADLDVAAAQAAGWKAIWIGKHEPEAQAM